MWSVGQAFESLGDWEVERPRLAVIGGAASPHYARGMEVCCSKTIYVVAFRRDWRGLPGRGGRLDGVVGCGLKSAIGRLHLRFYLPIDDIVKRVALDRFEAGFDDESFDLTDRHFLMGGTVAFTFGDIVIDDRTVEVVDAPAQADL